MSTIINYLYFEYKCCVGSTIRARIDTLLSFRYSTVVYKCRIRRFNNMVTIPDFRINSFPVPVIILLSLLIFSEKLYMIPAEFYHIICIYSQNL